MSRFSKEDLSHVRLRSIETRQSKVDDSVWGRPFTPGGSFSEFVDRLPDVLAARDLRLLADLIVEGRERERACIMMVGGHVVKVGLVPVIVDLIERGYITTLAMNSAAAIHDVESALFGTTSEDVAASIGDGSFGMARETGQFINETLEEAWRSDDPEIGYGEALGERLLASGAERSSLLATCVRTGTPVSVHVAIGADIVHQQPSMSGAATGELSFRDFRLLCHELRRLGDGGVVMNVGSNVILPEVFLKGLTVARNLAGPITNFTTANFDMIRHYRPRVNVVERPVLDGGRGFDFTGHHEIMIPLLAALIRERGTTK